MRRIRTCSLAFLIMVISAFASAGKWTAPVGSNCVYFIPSEQIESVIKAANEGSTTASLKLSLHYSIAMQNREQGNYWLDHAIELGDPEAMLSRAIGYMRVVKPDWETNARQLLLRAKEIAEKQKAQKLLAEIDTAFKELDETRSMLRAKSKLKPTPIPKMEFKPR